ncbi:MAG: LysR family transcriptional regulator [Deltaproteobacteria bacterium]|nr:LysR family transcriptional regulator [Deltaproteobacteria bacterium]
MQSTIELSLLESLDALLSSGSVGGAAERMGVSAPAMSRTLARLRAALGDPLLVRAGRGLVPTPRAVELRDRVRALVADARAVLGAAAPLSRSALERTFTVRASEAFVGPIAARLTELIREEAPRVLLRFAPEGDEDVAALRDGTIDLDLGVQGPLGPEVRVQTLLRDHLVGVVRRGHPLARGRVTVARFAAHPHVSVSRRGRPHGPIDDELGRLGRRRTVALVVPSFYGAFFAAVASDMVAIVPGRFAGWLAALAPVRYFALPVRTPALVIAQAWHPRFDADPAHRWLRGCVREAARSFVGDPLRGPTAPAG